MKYVDRLIFRLAQAHPLLLLSGILFALSLTLLGTSRGEKLVCDRATDQSVNCNVHRSQMLGFVKTKEAKISLVTEAKVDENIRQSFVTDSSGVIGIERTPVYGVLLVGHQNVVLDGYDADREHHQQIVQMINDFLSHPHEKLLVLKSKDYGLNLLTIGVLGSAIALSLFVWLTRKPKATASV